eukprot:MONOS_2093.1-p1 / transcript=MONOS_2093.1 / gene=MONOS_2093 / organism=Monocercomonoides_exilis_PA203 / gene_product=tubulin tyrosine ligase / transcript_product=tubulin tyrosine ligase / location=Mono_scaffold00041:38577-40004(+) / protein_length=391 / sequence_SO=supercontig / SO=protein_coding / is_pseudo=false
MKLDFLPLTYVLPQDYGIFLEAFKKRPGSLWIAKPLGQAQGRGIFVVSKLSQLADWKVDNRFTSSPVPRSLPSGSGADPNDPDHEEEKEKDKTYLIQSYISNPLLVGGKKFDMRVYVLVTSFLPLTVWLYRTGFARFSFSHFSLDPDNVDNQFVHLTNVAIQKHSSAYSASQGCKWDLRDFKLYVHGRYGFKAARDLFANMQKVIMQVVQAGQNVMIAERKCFELYGFDLIIDDTMKVWVLEVNASPSLTADTPADYHLKYVLLNDMLDVVDIEKRRVGVGGGAVSSSSTVLSSSSSSSNSPSPSPAASPSLSSSPTSVSASAYSSSALVFPPYIPRCSIEGSTVGGFDLIHRGATPIASPFSALCPSMLGTSNSLSRFPHELPQRLKKYE